jgi:osmotically-inducible protein OsmY
MKKIPTLLLAATLALPLGLHAADTDADNTAKNTRDRNGETLTPIDQSNDPADIKLTADIRKMLVKDDSLSNDAKNCKVITTAGGKVTLRGPVASQAEKEAVAAHATKAGATEVTNQLEVTTNH